MHTDLGPPGNESVVSRMRRAIMDDRITAALMAAIALMGVVSVVWLSY